MQLNKSWYHIYFIAKIQLHFFLKMALSKNYFTHYEVGLIMHNEMKIADDLKRTV